MDAVIWAEYRKRYCNPSRVQYASLNLDRFRKSLLRDHPTRQADVDDSLRRFDLEVCEIICERFPTNEQGHFENPIAVRAALKDLRPDLSMDAVDGRLEKIVKQTVFRRVQPSSTQEVAESSSCPSILFQPNTTMAWVQSEYRQRYCDEDGMPNRSMNIDVLRDLLLKARPENSEEIKGAVKKLGIQICEDICASFETDNKGCFKELQLVEDQLIKYRTDLNQRSVRKKVIKQLQDQRKSSLQAQMSTHSVTSMPKVPLQKLGSPSQNGAIGSDSERLKEWISSQYMELGFKKAGFIGWQRFAKALTQERPAEAQQIGVLLRELRQPGHVYSLKDPGIIQQERAKAKASGGVQLPKIQQEASPADLDATPTKDTKTEKIIQTSSVVTRSMAERKANSPTDSPANSMNGEVRFTPNQQLQAQLRRLAISDESSNVSAVDLTSESSSDDDGDEGVGHEEVEVFVEPDFGLIGRLAADRARNVGGNNHLDGINRDIGHAPLLSEAIVTQHARDLVPQFGFLGSEHTEGQDTKVFQNTNVPFSTFICGVQGSGKSHTTACMLENALITSPHLGRLQAPVSALVFSYSEFSNGGSAFAVSEAASLATASEGVATGRVKKVTVLTSPSNPAITRFYRAIPGVEVLPFKLKARTLDIGTLLTLMAVNEKAEVPLYMAKVESILRAIATESKDGLFDYNLFKERLALENFDPKQTNMLEMRLGLLESFLDKTNTVPDPKYRPGEVTIIDLSDPFVTPNTACILFKLGLERFMQSSVPGKMVVLDEAHKYMLNTPGSRILNDYLATLIRLQRHKGARIVISTQEPTVSTDLIALCAVTVVHRFTSPAWYAALKKHINAMDDDNDTMRQIECLDTGEALVYSPNSVLEKNFDGSLVKATGRLMRLSIRKRITRDGGESIMAI